MRGLPGPALLQRASRALSALPKSAANTSYVIVGAGSAGCTLAYRLTAQDPSCTVTLLEAGRSDHGRWDSWTIEMPAALTYSVADTRYNWDYYTVPQPGLNGRKVHEPRGKVVGGSSSINAMVYIRGHALDFERWAHKEGAAGWDYASVLPYFKRAQQHSLGANEYRGGNGPLQVKQQEPLTNPLFTAFVDAGVQAGYPATPDVNGHSQEGFGKFDMTIAKDGTRCSASKAYLRAAPQDRVKVLTSRFVKRVQFDGKRAVGVVLDDDSVIKADREVVLSAGAIGSPQILMLSGVGPSDHLKQVGIEVVADIPGVGSNLQDHLEVYLQYQCIQPVTLYPVGNWTLRYLHRRVAVGLEWFLRGTGLGSSNQFETGGFVRTRAGVQHPDVQYHFIPGAVLGQLEFLPLHAFQVHVGTMRPTSRGTVRLANRDPRQHPRIDPNFLSTEDDVEDMRAAARLADEIVQQPAFAPYRGERIRPTASEVGDIQRDNAALDAWLRASSHSAYHPSCTCAMGSVVDEQGRVQGLQSLRVVDASIMPSMTSGNLNAPTIMIAEKIADAMLGLPPLPKQSAPFYVHPQWQTAQR